MNLEFFIRARDMMSSQLMKAADTARKTTAMVKGVNGTLAQSYDEIKNKIQQVEAAISKSRSVSHIREARRELEALQRVAARSPGNVSGGTGGGWLGGMLRQALPMLGIAGALALGGNVLGSGLTAQARQTSFEVMAGKEQGTALNKDITKFARESIYGNELYQNAQTMMAFGATAKDVMPDLKMLGDIATGDKDKLGRLTLAFSQVRAAGKLMGQDLIQFVNAGFNPLQIMSEKTGLSLGVLREKMSDGAITFEMVKEAFQAATGPGGRFFDMTNKISKTDFGKWEAFKGQLEGLAMQVGESLAPAFGFLIENALVPLVNLLSASVEWIKQNTEWLAPLTIALGAAAAAYGIFTLAMNASTIATVFMTGAMKVLNFVMSINPIGAVIALIAALVAGIIYAWNHFEGFRKVVWGLWEVFKVVLTNIGEFFKKIFDPIFEAIAAIKEGNWGKAAAATGKLIWNLSGPGLIMEAVSFTKQGGFTKGIGDAWQAGQARGKNSSVTPEAAAATPGGGALTGGFAGIAGDDGGTAKGIAGGGPRIINVHINKMVETIQVTAANLDEGLNEIETKVEEVLLRVLNSGARVQ